ncbi:MAG: GGDEF domain-containing protein [Magnetococcales bacterium]|nr:GGDEF domain-containing protein [Magnetococcales bacterium]
METTVLADTDTLIRLEEEVIGKPAAIVLLKGDAGDSVFDLPAGTIALGRGWSNDIILQSTGVSRDHCRFQVDERTQNITVEDLGSSNGTFINNNRIAANTPTELGEGDIINVGGSQAFKYIPKGDVSRLSHDKLQDQANIDALTNCFNKGYLQRRYPILFHKSEALKSALSILVFDLDHFKKLNDGYGHDAGDYVLRELGRIVKEKGIENNKELFIRYGGEEFTIILPDTEIDTACERAEAVRALIDTHPFVYEGQTLPVTSSIGVAARTEATADPNTLFKKADAALYAAKNGGRNRVNCDRE